MSDCALAMFRPAQRVRLHEPHIIRRVGQSSCRHGNGAVVPQFSHARPFRIEDRRPLRFRAHSIAQGARRSLSPIWQQRQPRA